MASENSPERPAAKPKAPSDLQKNNAALALAPSLRLVFHVGGAVSPTLAIVAAGFNSERLAWASITFFFYSWICILTAATTNPRELWVSHKEPLRLIVR